MSFKFVKNDSYHYRRYGLVEYKRVSAIAFFLYDTMLSLDYNVVVNHAHVGIRRRLKEDRQEGGDSVDVQVIDYHCKCVVFHGIHIRIRSSTAYSTYPPNLRVTSFIVLMPVAVAAVMDT